MRQLLDIIQQGYSLDEVVAYALVKLLISNDVDITNINNSLLRDFIYKNSERQLPILDVFNYSLYDISSCIESSLSSKDKARGGVVFTPKYICDFIIRDTLSHYKEGEVILDPACGCGNFIFSILEYLKDVHGISFRDTLSKYLYCYDINSDFVKYTKILCAADAVMHGEDCELFFNIEDADYLSTKQACAFDYIIGNPPYINNHDLGDEQIDKLKLNFLTTTTGTFNIFYAFIEKSLNELSDNGTIEFIIPNNFIYIKSAEPLRRFLSEGVYVDNIIDFNDNTIFAPALTYNCIIKLSKKSKTAMRFASVKKTNDIRQALDELKFIDVPLRGLRESVWELTCAEDLEKIRKIESYDLKLGKYIKTGIATLKDAVFILNGFDKNEQMFYKKIGDKKYYIEPNIALPFIKVSKYSDANDLMHIIFPYSISNGATSIMTEEVLSRDFPLAYRYLIDQKPLLESRNSSRAPIITPWYAYGRSQGLSNWGDKLYFSTFSEKPNFRLINSDKCLFANGYSINDIPIDYEVLIRILNSSIMEFYIDKTSYVISGNYKCYQKKYLKNFSIPQLQKDDIEYIMSHDGEELNNYLEHLYFTFI